jgi:hypothetical protein
LLKAGAELPFTRLLLSDRERTRRRSTARTRSTAAGGAAVDAASAPADAADSAATAAAAAADVANVADVADVAAISLAAKADGGNPAGTNGGRATCSADAGGGGTRDCLLYCVLTTVSRRDL